MPPASNNACVRTRKRVRRACDRCHLKKSKCDGSSPCRRCKNANTICVFAERKRPHGRIYPEGYVEMLEQQQSQLAAGVRELYRILNAGECWPGAPLAEQEDGHPLTHAILERLGVLQQNYRFIRLTSFQDGFTSVSPTPQTTEAQSCPPLQLPTGSESSCADASPSSSSYSQCASTPTTHLGSALTDFPATLASIDQDHRDAQHHLWPDGFDVTTQSQFSRTGYEFPYNNAVEAMQTPCAADDSAFGHRVYYSVLDSSH